MNTIRHLLKGRSRGVLGHEQAMKAAVLVPLVEVDGHWSVVFEKRAQTLSRQAGEICFPGGRVDVTDPDEQYTAIRETREELGVLETEIELIGELDIFMPSEKLTIFPYVGVLSTRNFHPNMAEVAEVFTVSLSTLLAYHPHKYEIWLEPKPAPDYPYHLIPQGRNYPFRKEYHQQWFYEMEHHVIWGMTARLLTHFLDLVRQSAHPNPEHESMEVKHV